QISTKEVYENVKAEHISDLTQARSQIKILMSLWRILDTNEMEKLLFNRLEEVTLKTNKEIEQIRKVLETRLGRRFVLTGSGAGVYALRKKGEQISIGPSEISKLCRHYKTESYRTSAQKEEQHGNN
ncbi:MAG: hypothetical protein NC907_06080, partial [Candidatus Omnitrophica bacterium]|nr:hypothetical protein [Candidatus Omnitrophota bacterium]